MAIHKQQPRALIHPGAFISLFGDKLGLVLDENTSQTRPGPWEQWGASGWHQLWREQA